MAKKTTRRIIGLTGGIATGKSTVSEYLASRYSLPILDADVYSRLAVEKGSDVLGLIVCRYGSEILLPDGTLNRTALGKIVFGDPDEKRWLEQQIHPFVRDKFRQVAASFSSEQTLVYSIPLLFEANLTHLVTEVWVVFCEHNQQKARLMVRNQLSAEDAQARINAQMAIEKKCDRADFVVDNSGSKDALFAQVDDLL